MTDLGSRLLEQALALPPDKRAELAEKLLSSLGSASRDEVDEFWIREAEARLDAYRRGETQAIPAKDAIDELREELGR